MSSLSIINRFKPRSEFGRNVFTLMIGTGISQVIPLVISPILTRLYAPNHFGVFSLYVAIVTVISVIATGRYELAIMLPRKDSDASNLLVLSICIAAIISFILMGIVFTFNAEITTLSGNPEVSKVLYLIPFSVLATSMYQNFRYYNNRLKHYSSISVSRVSQSTVTGLVNIGTGLVSMGAIGLALGALLGYLTGIANLSRSAGISTSRINRKRILALSKKYSHYPKFDILSSFFNDLSQQAPGLLFMPVFGATFAGYYFLIQRLFMMPIKLISTTIAEVFRQEAASHFNRHGSFEGIFLVTLKKLVVVSLIPFLPLMLFGRELFTIVFGANWETAGVYTQILAPMFMLKFIVSPLTYSFYIRNQLVLNMLGQLMYLLCMLSSIAIGYFTHSAQTAVIAISVSLSFVYLTYLVISYALAKQNCKRQAE